MAKMAKMAKMYSRDVQVCLQELKEDGTLNELLIKWFGDELGVCIGCG